MVENLLYTEIVNLNIEGEEFCALLCSQKVKWC